MRVVCPRCRANYDVTDDAVESAGGLASCGVCNTPFDVAAGRELMPGSFDHSKLLRLETTVDPESPASTHEGPPILPFDVPDDLPPLEAEHDIGLDAPPGARKKRPLLRFVGSLLALVLVIGLLAQLVWGYRDDLLARYPVLEPICAYVPCRATFGRETDAFSVIKRDIKPTANVSDSLTLNVTFFNSAAFAQPYPDIQLSLVDNSGNTVVRRRLDPNEYLFPVPPEGSVIAPGEVITISVDFVDPGHLATGFVIDFL